MLNNKTSTTKIALGLCFISAVISEYFYELDGDLFEGLVPGIVFGLAISIVALWVWRDWTMVLRVPLWIASSVLAFHLAVISTISVLNLAGAELVAFIAGGLVGGLVIATGFHVVFFRKRLYGLGKSFFLIVSMSILSAVGGFFMGFFYLFALWQVSVGMSLGYFLSKNFDMQKQSVANKET